MEDFEKGKVIARRYRNRRIGDFLKELDLSEGRSTGVPKIRRNMQQNGSPKARFETDKDRTYFLATLPIHPEFEEEDTASGKRRERLGKGWEKVGKRLGKMNQSQQKICQEIHRNEKITIDKLSEKIGISTTAIEKNISKLKENGILKRVGGRKEGHWELQLD